VAGIGADHVDAGIQRQVIEAARHVSDDLAGELELVLVRLAGDDQARVVHHLGGADRVVADGRHLVGTQDRALAQGVCRLAVDA
jgi:hypothetical protein